MNISMFLSGAIVLANLVIGVFFLRFFRDYRDRLFLFFSASFIFDALERALPILLAEVDEGAVWIFAMRMAAYVLIVVAIIDKNRQTGKTA